MTIHLPLQPQEEARLIALARAKGLSADALVREALDKLLTEAPGPHPEKSRRDRSAACLPNTARRRPPRKSIKTEPTCLRTFHAPISDDRRDC